MCKPSDLFLSQMPRFVISFLLSIFLAAFISSCEKTGFLTASERPRNENILHYDVNFPFTSLNPTEVYSSGSIMIFPLLYDYLFVPNAQGELEPVLARKWSYDGKNFTWTISLREKARFHDKAPVTSADVKYSLNEVLKQTYPALHGLIDHISLLSPEAISIRLKKNDSRFLAKIWKMDIVPRPGGGETDNYNHPVGSGPFRFEYRKGEKEVGLVANEDYFKGRPALGRIVFHFQPVKEKTWTRLLSGKTDVAHEISSKNYEIIRQYERRFYVDLYTLRWCSLILYNTTDPLFFDIRVRQALTHAIDRQYIVEKIVRGFGVVGVGPMGVNSPFHNPEVKPLPYDPKKGLKLLEAAGWSYDKTGRQLVKDGKPFAFTILVFEESQIEKKIARYIRLCLNDLGIKANLLLLPGDEFTRRFVRNNDFQAVLTEMKGAYGTPETLKQQWCSDGVNVAEAGCFQDPEVTRLITKAIDEEDPDRQVRLLYKADERMASLQPGTFLFHKTAIDVMSKRFKVPLPFSLTMEGVHRLRYASLNPD
ncbi:MAG: ABC transporter substrate-binding protein [Thermodesulfobacteriota bacterium]|nr:ABC transporter substrate-binding protein [Thermodesulfobacteriota bacterium]